MATIECCRDRIAVDNSVYFQYFEQARLDHLAGLGFVPRFAKTEGPQLRFAILETTCRYKAPAYYRDVLLVKVGTTEIRQQNFVLSYEVTRESDGLGLAEGSSVQVWLDAAGRATPLPDALRSALEASR